MVIAICETSEKGFVGEAAMTIPAPFARHSALFGSLEVAIACLPSTPISRALLPRPFKDSEHFRSFQVRPEDLLMARRGCGRRTRTPCPTCDGSTSFTLHGGAAAAWPLATRTTGARRMACSCPRGRTLPHKHEKSAEKASVNLWCRKKGGLSELAGRNAYAL